jgi:hypothetical protein
MTIAELHGKLSPKRAGGFYERMEDLLTSDVFGTMKYTGWEAGFLNWLRSAKEPMDNFKTADLVLPSDDEISWAEYRFWPTVKSGREPDLLIALHQKSGKVTLIIVEAKYLSGPSNIEMEGEFTVAGLTGDQIADQINDFPDILSENSREVIAARIHIYLTAHHSCPMEIFGDSKKNIRRNDVSYFWLNWQALPGFLESELPRLEDRSKLLVQDLVDLLKRKDLVPFRGFRLADFDITAEYPEFGFWKEKWWQAGSTPHVYEMTGFWRET